MIASMTEVLVVGSAADLALTAKCLIRRPLGPHTHTFLVVCIRKLIRNPRREAKEEGGSKSLNKNTGKTNVLERNPEAT